MMEDLARRGVTHLLVDAGPTLGQSLIDQNLADRVWVIHSKMVVGEKDAPDAPVAPWRGGGSIDVAGGGGGGGGGLNKQGGFFSRWVGGVLMGGGGLGGGRGGGCRP